MAEPNLQEFFDTLPKPLPRETKRAIEEMASWSCADPKDIACEMGYLYEPDSLGWHTLSKNTTGVPIHGIYLPVPSEGTLMNKG